MEVDKVEAKLALSHDLPADPFQDYEATDEIDLPLTAFSYLVRRLAVSLFLSLIIFVWV